MIRLAWLTVMVEYYWNVEAEAFLFRMSGEVFCLRQTRPQWHIHVNITAKLVKSEFAIAGTKVCQSYH